MKKIHHFAILALALASLAAPGRGQVEASRVRLPGHVVIPQTRSFSPPRVAAVGIEKVAATVRIREQVATTTMDILLRNPGSRRLESVLLVPVPDGAVVRGFDFQGTGNEPSARLLPREEARRTYDAIVSKYRDPALLEFVGCRLVRSSVFPVETGGTQRVRLVYENLLAADGDRVEYVLPRSESLDYRIPWSIDLSLESAAALSTVYSPSHPIETRRLGPGTFRVRTTPDAQLQPGSFRLSYLLAREGVSASLIAYPDPKVGGGYFLLLAGLLAEPPREGTIRREVTLVIDRSGSMNGEKIEQVRAAVRQILAGLDWGETFNIIPYTERVEAFAPAPVAKTEETLKRAHAYVSSILPRGGTNIHDALLEALRQKPERGVLPIVLFLTDGLPTVGRTAEVDIRKVSTHANPWRRRIFTFGVGVDVNTPLLEKIAWESRATSTFVLPGEDVEVKVANVFERLSGPVLADPELAVLEPDGKPALGRVQETLPAGLPDLFEGDQLVLLGQYIGEGPIRFRLSGNFLGESRAFEFDFGFDRASTRNAFVPRLWASRKIGVLVDQIRELGAAGGDPFAPPHAVASDPRFRELVDEIVALSTEFGILTEYTAFLATEGSDLTTRDRILTEAQRRFDHRAVRSRTGWGSVNQDVNNLSLKMQSCLLPTNAFYDDTMQRVEIRRVQQVSDRAFYRRGDTWVDGRLLAGDPTPSPQRVVQFGSEGFCRILDRLEAHGRQGCVSLRGNILIEMDGERILVQGPGTENPTEAAERENDR